MKRLALLIPLLLLLVGCGGKSSSAGDSGTKGTMDQDCEITGDKSKAELANLEDGKTHLLVVDTNKGSFTIELDTKTSPCTTASIAGLAQKGFFDGLTFHRIVPGFVIQGGDPEGTGMGGPGYQTVDSPPSNTKYTKGVAAMAKTQTDPPGAAGSQFFVVTGDDAGLTPDYAVLGKVVEGLDTVEKIGQLGDPSDRQGRPTERVEIKDVKLRSS